MIYNWNNRKLKLIIDITSYCNAKCPQCSRTNENGLDRYDFIPLVHWSLPEIMLAYPKDQLIEVDYVQQCPTWGDAMMNPEIYEISKYFIETLPRGAKYHIITNGSMRDENFWFTFGGLGVIARNNGVEFQVQFDIDGITQEMHSHYRRNTYLQKTLNNMKAFSESPFARVRSQSIIFKHNQDYMKDIKSLAEEYGSTQHTFIKSSRFIADENGRYMPSEFIDENGNKQILEWADVEFQNPFLGQVGINEIRSQEIRCKWSMNNALNINFDGQVWPCCYFGNLDYSKYTDKFHSYPIIQEYNLNRLEYNVKFTPIRDIVDSNYFKKQLSDMMINEPTKQCERQCSERIRPVDQLEVRTREV